MTVLGSGDLRERARGAVDRTPVLVACSHGTSSLVGQRAVSALVDAVVLAVAGSSDARAVDDCEAMGRMLGHAIGREVLVGYISAVKPALPDAVETARSRSGGRRVVVATYLLAPGYFADLAGRAGADVVTEPLLSAADPAPHEMVELVVERFGF